MPDWNGHVWKTSDGNYENTVQNVDGRYTIYRSTKNAKHIKLKNIPQAEDLFISNITQTTMPHIKLIMLVQS